LSDANTNDHEPAFIKKIFHAIGPGLVTACVVIGPGSILTSSQVGAKDGFSKIWVVLVAVFFMGTYTTMAVKLGISTKDSPATLVTKHAGRWLAALIGCSVFFISAAYQFGNNLGVHAAINSFIEFKYWVIIFNAITLLFVFGFRNLYKVLERLMSFFVAMMLISFAVNLFFAKPDVVAMAKGALPLSGLDDIGLPLLGLVGTTFVVSAAFYQSYLVRFKGWEEKDIKNGLFDARVSAGIMAVITLMLMCTAAAVFYGKNMKPTSVVDVAESLSPLFGNAAGKYIFCLGLFSAAFPSFIVNSMIGGFILFDALGIGSRTEDRWPRLLTGAVLLTGMGVALFVIHKQSHPGFEHYKPMALIVAAQAATVLASTLVAETLLWLTNKESIMGKHKNGVFLNASATVGLIILLLMSYRIVDKIVNPTAKKPQASSVEQPIEESPTPPE